ncbi:transcriptional regulator, AraC family [Thiomonas bhubaneswarensis]|uniref:Transcriptional regulator, AraC family n=2 Tax=Thiomonas bhubaneswarensis TaxID=339866 RepID=A0A0K6HX26_9BURK|nr:transcriptional regulator, AraC family [Thiomonas bhubaneswarensis]
MAGLLYYANEYRKHAKMPNRLPSPTECECSKAELLARINHLEGAELIAVSMRNPLAMDAETHCHARGTLFLLTEGLVIVETAQGRQLTPSQTIGWMPPGVPHAVQSYGPTAGYGAFLTPQLCGDLPAEPISYPVNPLVSLILQKALSWPHDAPLDLSRMRLLLVLLDELRQSPARPLQLPWPQDARLLSIARGLLDHIASARTLEQWARWADISPRTLSRKFLIETGMSFAQWRQWARLTQALEWLATGRAVKDVALSLGYDSVSAFIKTFRQALGTTPSAYFQAQQRNRPLVTLSPTVEAAPTLE